MKKIRVGVQGATGKMGRLLVQSLHFHPHLKLELAIVRDNSQFIGQPVYPNNGQGPVVCFSDQLDLSRVDVVIDFSSPKASLNLVEAAKKTKTPLLIGTTGLSAEQKNSITEASHTLPILLSSNTSLGVNTLSYILPILCKMLPDFDLELLEIHHRQKKDAPSGTAQLLIEAIKTARPEIQPLTDRGLERKTKNDMMVASLRGGTIPGTHTVYFLGEEEFITITHEATSRQIFVDGALKAALWLVSKPNGLYSMQDVLITTDI